MLAMSQHPPLVRSSSFHGHGPTAAANDYESPGSSTTSNTNPQAPNMSPTSGTATPSTTPSTTDSNIYYQLEVVQQPIQARAMGWGAKADSRRPVDPPPVINFQVRTTYNHEPITHDITNNFILHASLKECESEKGSSFNQNQFHHHHHHHPGHEQGGGGGGAAPMTSATGRDSAVPSRLTGTTMASLTHIRSPAPGKFFFLLHDLSIRQEGRYQLVFNVYEVMADQGCIKHRAQTVSQPIQVYSPKTFPGLETSSDLIKEIASQGCRVRVRKESTVKRKNSKKRHSVATIPPHVANHLVNNMPLPNFGNYKEQQVPQPVMYAPVQYHPQYMDQMYDPHGPPPPPPPHHHHPQPGHQLEYHHPYAFDEYRATSMSSASSNASTAPPPPPPPHLQQPNYYRGYEALLSAAAHQQQQHHQPPAHPNGEYQTLPPTPAMLYDRSGGDRSQQHPQQQQQPPPQQQQDGAIRNHRSQSYPMPGMPVHHHQPPTLSPQSPQPVGSPHYEKPDTEATAQPTNGQYDHYYHDPYFQQLPTGDNDGLAFAIPTTEPETVAAAVAAPPETIQEPANRAPTPVEQDGPAAGNEPAPPQPSDMDHGQRPPTPKEDEVDVKECDF